MTKNVKPENFRVAVHGLTVWGLMCFQRLSALLTAEEPLSAPAGRKALWLRTKILLQSVRTPDPLKTRAVPSRWTLNCNISDS